MSTDGRRLAVGLLLAATSLLALPPQTHAQLYAVKPPRTVWDSWLFRDGADYHLFYLQGPRDDRHIGRAVSQDLLRWKRLPWIDSVDHGDAWDRKITHTGFTVKIGDRYACLYGSSGTGRQLNGVMFFDDLLHWEKYAGNPVLVSTPPHYGGTDWRDPTAYYDPDEDLWHGYICAQTAAHVPSTPKLPTITEKTLVAWVTRATLDQGGGSVLTLDKDNVIFDAVVFAETWPRRWMAGSDNARRGQKDQSAYPIEAAGSGELLQIAIVYHGNDITIYRNGERYAGYTAPEQAEFGDGTAVLMGLRHAAVKVGAANCFAGSIEEARVYSEALSEEAVRSLQLEQADNPKPLARWTFEDGTARNDMDTFPPGELRGGAKIADGRLHLDGIDDYLITPRTIGRNVPCIGHFTSKDLIHWNYLPPVYENAEFADLEVPDYFTQAGWHYLLFSSARTRRDTPSRRQATGTYYVMSEHRDGPYRLPPDPLILGSGAGRLDNYVGRALPDGDGHLLYHHTVGGVVVWGTIKQIKQNDNGTLRLEHWPGLDGLKTRSLNVSSTNVPDESVSPSRAAGGSDAKASGEGSSPLSGPDRTVMNGQWIEHPTSFLGNADQTTPALYPFPSKATDLMLTCRIEGTPNLRGGMFCRYDGKHGIGVQVNRAERTVQVLELHHDGERWETKILDTRYNAPLEDESDHLRMLARDHRLEVYLNDQWMFGLTMTDALSGAGLGLLAGSEQVQFTDVRAAELEPLVATDP